MGESKSKKRKVGQTVEVPERGVVIRPDGVSVTVVGGTYVLSHPGHYTVEGEAMEVK